MYQCLMNNIKRFLAKNNLDIPFQIDAKPMYIDDVFGGVTEEGTFINVTTFYRLLEEGITSVKVFRRPIVGILHRNPNLGKALTYFSEEIGLFTIDLGIYRNEKDVERGFKLTDILTIMDRDIMVEDLLKECIAIPWIKFSYSCISIYRSSLRILVVENNILSGVGAILYFIRPYIQYFFKEPISFYPIIYLGPGNKEFEIYPVNHNLNNTVNPEDFYGFKIICDRGSFLEKLFI